MPNYRFKPTGCASGLSYSLGAKQHIAKPAFHPVEKPVSFGFPYATIDGSTPHRLGFPCLRKFWFS